MQGSHGHNHTGSGTVSSCFQFIPWLVWNSDELLYGCLESQYIELCEAALTLLLLLCQAGYHGYDGE